MSGSNALTKSLRTSAAERRANPDGAGAVSGASLAAPAGARMLGRAAGQPLGGEPIEEAQRRTPLQTLLASRRSNVASAGEIEEPAGALGASSELTPRKNRATSSGSADVVTPLGSRRQRGFRAGREMLG